MKKNQLKKTLSAAVIIALLSVFSLSSSFSSESTLKLDACCIKKKQQDCPGRKQKDGTEELIMETMTRQFIAIPMVGL